jgi:hypothetical protein
MVRGFRGELYGSPPSSILGVFRGHRLKKFIRRLTQISQIIAAFGGRGPRSGEIIICVNLRNLRMKDFLISPPHPAPG